MDDGSWQVDSRTAAEAAGSVALCKQDADAASRAALPLRPAEALRNSAGPRPRAASPDRRLLAAMTTFAAALLRSACLQIIK